MKNHFMLAILLTILLPLQSNAGAKIGVSIEYEITIENLKNIETQAKNILSQPADQQHGDINDEKLGFKGYLSCQQIKPEQSECKLNIYESNFKASPGKFQHYLVLAFNLRSLTQTISFLEFALRSTPESAPIVKPQVLSQDNESSIACAFEKNLNKRVCTFSIWLE